MAVRLRWFLAFSSVLVAVVGLTVVLHDRLDDGSGAGDQVISDGGDAPDVGAADSVESGQIAVSGKVTAIHLEGAVLEPRDVPTPLTITSDRGLGNGGEVTGVTVDGKLGTVVWDGGRPFQLASGPGLTLDPITVDLVDSTIACALAPGVHVLRPGAYRLDTPVAFGSSGVATSHDSLSFQAGADARFSGNGDAALVLSSDGEHTFTGPGLVHLEGDLVIDRPIGAQSAVSLDLESAPFRLTFSPTEGGGWTVSGRVESRVIGDLKLG